MSRPHKVNADQPTSKNPPDRTFRILPDIVPFPPPGFPRMSIIWDSYSGAGESNGCVDMKLRCCAPADVLVVEDDVDDAKASIR
jgi:hypothetical protein